MISFPQVESLELADLKLVLSPAIADFRLWQRDREDIEPGKEWKPPVPTLTHMLQRWVISRGADLRKGNLSDHLVSPGLWHAQVARDPDHPKERGYYVRLRLHNGTWEVDWIGYAWYWAVYRGLLWIDEHEGRLEAMQDDIQVRLVSTSLYKFTSFWFQPMNLHLVVSSTEDFLPKNKLIEEAYLRDLLVERFEPGRHADGIASRGVSGTQRTK